MARNETPESREERKKQHKHRDWAFTLGVLKGIGIIALGVAIVFIWAAWMESFELPTILTGTLISGIILLAAGIWMWREAAKMDEENYMIQKATPMPLRLVNIKDDVWVEGRLRVPHPAVAPHFGQPCAYFHYTLEEERTRTVSTKNGTRTERYWVTIQDTTRYARTFLVEDDIEIEVDVRKARIDYPPSKSDRIGRYRHSLTYIPWKGNASACGVLVKNPRMEGSQPAASDDDNGELREARTRVYDRTRKEANTAGSVGIFNSLFGAPRGEQSLGKMAQKRQARRDQGERQQRAAQRLERRSKKAGKGKLSKQSDDAKVGVEFDEDLTPMDVEGEAPEPEPEKRSDVPATRTPLLLVQEGNVPLVLTPLPRDEWVDRAEAKETRFRVASVFVVWGAIVGLFAWLTVNFGMIEVFVSGLIGGGIAGVIIMIPTLTISLYNRFVGYRTRVASAWAQIDVLLKMRRELIPNLVSTVEASVQHEKDVLEKVTKLRSTGLGATPKTGAEMMQIENAVSAIARDLTVTVEDYPELKTNDAYRRLMRELTAIEEKIAWSRSFYNETVREYNIMIEALPNSLLASPLGFKDLPYWRDETGKSAAVPELAVG